MPRIFANFWKILLCVCACGTALEEPDYPCHHPDGTWSVTVRNTITYRTYTGGDLCRTDLVYGYRVPGCQLEAEGKIEKSPTEFRIHYICNSTDVQIHYRWEG